jgi:hypothetical protein
MAAYTLLDYFMEQKKYIYFNNGAFCKFKQTSYKWTQTFYETAESNNLPNRDQQALSRKGHLY